MTAILSACHNQKDLKKILNALECLVVDLKTDLKRDYGYYIHSIRQIYNAEYKRTTNLRRLLLIRYSITRCTMQL